MERTRLLQNGATGQEPGAILAAGECSPHTFSQGDGAAIQTDSSKIKAHAHALKQNRPARFGLPCANCKAYYASDLSACPICKCAERVPAEEAEAESANRLKKPPAGVLQGALGCFNNLDSTPGCKQPMRLGLHCDDDGERFLLESKMLLYAHTEEINADPTSPCILDENHNTQSEHASICLSCYDQLGEKLARTEAALLIDLCEAAQIVYRAVWADPSPADPSRTYHSAAQALLNELCQRAGIMRFPGAV
jgi:hypothetical protein